MELVLNKQQSELHFDHLDAMKENLDVLVDVLKGEKNSINGIRMNLSRLCCRCCFARRCCSGCTPRTIPSSLISLSLCCWHERCARRDTRIPGTRADALLRNEELETVLSRLRIGTREERKKESAVRVLRERNLSKAMAHIT